jgi:hypothetical protein
MRIVGKDAMPLSPPRDVFTLFIGSGETYETITLADPAYGVNANAGSPLSSPHPDSPSNLKPAGTLNGRISYPIHSHDDYKVTTNGFYPGGGLVLIETCVDPNSVPKLPPATSDPFDVLYNSLTIGRPSFEDPYVLPRAGIPADRGDIEELPAPAPQIDPVTGKQLGCPGLPPH